MRLSAIFSVWVTLLLFGTATVQAAQEETPSCSYEDVYYLGLGTGVDGRTAFRTQFWLHNLADEELETRLLLFQSSGEPWATDSLRAEWPDAEGTVVASEGRTEITLPPLGTLILTLEGQSGGRLGWSCLTPGRNLTSRVEMQVARIPVSAEPEFRNHIETIAEIEPSVAAKRLVFPLHYLAGYRQLNTALSIANVSAGEGTVTAVLSPADPEQAVEKTVVLKPGELVADYWNTFWGIAHPAVLGLEDWKIAEISASFPIAISVQSTLQGLPVSGVKVAAGEVDGHTVEASLGEEVELAVGETAAFGDELTVQFRNLPADSRCPEDVQCVWEGEAVVELQVSGAVEEDSLVRLTTYGDRNVAVVGNYRIELLKVTPSPTAERQIEIEEYRIRISVQTVE